MTKTARKTEYRVMVIDAFGDVIDDVQNDSDDRERCLKEAAAYELDADSDEVAIVVESRVWKMELDKSGKELEGNIVDDSEKILYTRGCPMALDAGNWIR